MNIFTKKIIYIFLLLLFSGIIWAEDVTIQLKWQHSFQFCGYYAALEKGFYANEGLNVTLKEWQPGSNYVAHVLIGDAEYGVGDTGLLLDFLDGKNVVLLKQIFQRSPYAFITLKESGIDNPYDLANKKVMNDTSRTFGLSLKMLLKKSLNNEQLYSAVNHSYNIEDLINKKVDAYACYLSSQPYDLMKLGIDYNIIYPENYGISFYGDNLFTSTKELREHPERIKKVISATLKGWEYALSHQDEMIDIIKEKYQPGASREKLLFEQNIIYQMISPDLIPLGHISPEKYENIYKMLLEYDLTNKTPELTDFLYEGLNKNQRWNLLKFTSAEKKWLNEHPVIPLVVENSVIPYSFVDEDGNYTGIMGDFSRKIESTLGIEFEYENKSYGEIVETIKNHDRTLVTCFDPYDYPAYTEHYLKNDDIVYMPFALFTLEGNPLLNEDQNTFSNKKIGILNGWNLGHPALSYFQDCEFFFGENQLECLNMLLRGEVDGIYDVLPTINYLITNKLIKNVKLVKIFNDGMPMAYFVNKDSKELHGILNKTIASFDKDYQASLLKKWGGQFNTPAYNLKILKLTHEERRWLADHPVLTVGSDQNWAPVEWMDNNGKFSGIAIDYLKELEQLLGIRLKIDLNSNWQELIEKAKNNKLDMFSCIKATPDRRKYLNFTKPYLSFPIKIYVHKETKGIKKLEDLNNKTLAVVKDYAIQELVERDYKHINIITVKNTVEGLKLLDQQKVDAFTGSFLTVNDIISRNNITSIKVGGETKYSYDISMGVRKDWPILISILEKAIDSIPEVKKKNIYQKWIPITQDSEIDYSILWKIGIPIFIIILAIIIWNRELKRAIKNKTVALQSSESSLKEAERLAKLGHWEYLPIEDKFTWSDEVYEIFETRPWEVELNFDNFLGFIHQDDIIAVDNTFSESLKHHHSFTIDYRLQLDDMKIKYIHNECRIKTDANTGQIRILGTIQDITERRLAEKEREELQEQVKQSEKMQAIGQLAGGIAHDFNNQLSCIIGYADLLVVETDDTDCSEYADNILKAARRAADLTKNLLAFSRKGKNLTSVINIHEIIEEVITIVERSIDKKITIFKHFNTKNSRTIGDPSQLQNALLNLAINARDAMPEGGKLIFTTNVVSLHEPACKYPPYELTAGDYLKISVSDTGTGMTDEVKARVFEPFFTTKDVGKGTGMGLASVFGTVRNHKGCIFLNSKPGDGTTFHVFLPVVEIVDKTEEKTASIEPSKLSARILIIDDEELLRNVGSSMLRKLGFEVETCEDGESAVQFYAREWAEIDLVILDINMPGMDGYETFLELKKINKNIKTIIASGYSKDGTAQAILDAGALDYIAKPFSRVDIAQKLKNVLEK